MDTIIGGDEFIPQVFTSDIDLRRENITTMGSSSTTITPEELKADLLNEKLIVLFSMLVVTFLFGMIPLKLFSTVRDSTDLTSRVRWKTILSFASCFAGGVFIAACLLDLVPDVEEKIQEVLNEIKDTYHVDLDYPLAQFIICLGFFFILTIEQSVLYFQESWMASNQERQPLLSRSRTSSTNTAQQNYNTHTPVEDSITGISDEVHYSNDGHADHNHISHGVFEHSSLRSILLLLALSLHSIFEGLAIGLQEENSNLISIFIAVITHKAVMAFSLGLNIAQSNMSVKAFVISNVIFSCASPFGLGLGILLTDLPSSLPQNIANSILQGISGGTFLYITFFEVLPHELNAPTNRLWKVMFVVLGFACICGLLFIAH